MRQYSVVVVADAGGPGLAACGLHGLHDKSPCPHHFSQVMLGYYIDTCVINELHIIQPSCN